MAVQTNGNVGADEAKAAQTDGNKNNGSFWYRSPEGMASISFGSDWRRSMIDCVGSETVLAACSIVQVIVGLLMFVAGAAVGKLL